MKRCASEELVFMLAAGELAEDQAARVAEHVRGCDKCAKLLAGYEKTLSALRTCEASTEDAGKPSAAEWDRLMVGVRQRVKTGALVRPGVPWRLRVLWWPRIPSRPGILDWPVWAKGLAGGGVAVAAAALVLVGLWQAGLLTGSRPGTTPGIAVRGQVAEVTAPTAEGPGGQEPPAGELLAEDRLSEEALAGDLPAEDGSTINLASLDSDLPELDEMIEGVGGTQDSEFMLLYLTEEEETRLVKELEGLTNVQESD